MMVVPEYIPSPSQGVWHLGSFPIRGYALCILAGIFAAIWLSQKRWNARGGRAGELTDLAIWIVPIGIIGGRLYHVITDHELYFGSDAPNPWYHIFFIWDGGLGIWGAILLPALVGIWLFRKKGIRYSALADVLAPGLLLAQGMGRWGNWFNQELFGRPTTLPWALEISPGRRPEGYTQYATFNPCFLYSFIWDVSFAGVVLWLDRRLKLGYGRCFALYVMCYCAGRFWIEYLRIDEAADGAHFLGLRFNDWTSIVCFAGALAYFVWAGLRHPAPDTRPASVYLDGHSASETAVVGGNSVESSQDELNGARARWGLRE